MRIQIIRKRAVKYIKISLLIIRPEIINQAAKPGIGCRFEDHIALFQHVSPYTSGNLVPGAGDQCNSAPKPRRLRRLLRQVTLELSQNGVTSMFTQADVTKQEQWRDSAAAVIKEYGRIDVLVNNTGIFKDGSALTSSEEDFKRIMDVNVNGVYLGMQAVLPQMIRQQKGSVINIASETGLIAIANQIAYNTSKAAVIMMTKSVAVDFAADGIRANCICPGRMHTSLVQRILDSAEDYDAQFKLMSEDRPLMRMGTPDEVAMGAVYLASDESPFATGSVLSIDGGYACV